MQVIFVKDLKKQGKKGEIKEVSDGYEKNYLIKNGYAVINNKENLQKLKHEQAKKEKENLALKEKATEIKKELDKVVLEFKVKTGTDDNVFGSVSVKQIKDELNKKGYDIDKKQIKLDNSIASLGFHNVILELYPKIEASIKIHLIK